MLQIVKPTMLIDKEICLNNIRKMAEKACRLNLKFRPHFKTHQSAQVGEWFRESGVETITVSSVQMARYFRDHGWKDITIAFPVNILEIDEINRLAMETGLNLLVDNEVSLSFLKAKIAAPVGIYFETDTGHHRSGIEVADFRKIDQMLQYLKNDRNLVFKGFLSHSGHNYAARSVEEIAVNHSGVVERMNSLKCHYLPAYPGVEISLGDTPACSVCDNWEGVDEIRPGNFIFYDLMQYHLGVCKPGDIAAKVICPVVSKSDVRSEAVIYGGAIHLSKEFLMGRNGERTYGSIVRKDFESTGKAFPDELYVSGLSQEHGIIRGPSRWIAEMEIGELLEVVPVHSCLAADLAGNYLTTSGEVIAKMGK